MENFIYLIILIAWIVFALYRQSQKKKAQGRPPASRQAAANENRSFQSLEEIFFGDKMSTSEMWPEEEETVTDIEPSNLPDEQNKGGNLDGKW